MTEQAIYQHLRDHRHELSHTPRFSPPEISHGQLLWMMSPALHHQRVSNRL
ncbi:hypothetical protein [Streptomyces luteireticuli]|uniref:hypothetical protein n=1 Tax=Streptomyces luteireticuli TaxID=173858 RepID=UPI003555F288